MILPAYLAEIAPPAYRGRLVTSLSILITGGQVVAYLIDAAFANVREGWRWMFGLGAVPAILQLLLSFSIPESPRYHLKKGKVAAARKTLKLLNPKLSPARLQRKIEEIQREVGAEEEGVKRRESSKKEQFALIWHDRASRRALVVACGLQLFQQLTGSVVFLSFSSHIVEC
jgi:SP family myo-inositol transporter-like MFS transporter 13